MNYMGLIKIDMEQIKQIKAFIKQHKEDIDNLWVQDDFSKGAMYALTELDKLIIKISKKENNNASKTNE